MSELEQRKGILVACASALINEDFPKPYFIVTSNFECISVYLAHLIVAQTMDIPFFNVDRHFRRRLAARETRWAVFQTFPEMDLVAQPQGLTSMKSCWRFNLSLPGNPRNQPSACRYRRELSMESGKSSKA